MNKETETVTRPMSPTAIRLAASIATIPFCFGAFLIMGVALEDFAGLTDPTQESFALTAIVAIGLWIAIWRKRVCWSPSVMSRTAALAIVCLAFPIFLLFVFGNNSGGSWNVLLGCLPIMGWGLWMAISITIWPTHAEYAELGSPEPRCLGCGYRMTGLTDTRCPECGDQPTLEQLWAGNSAGI